MVTATDGSFLLGATPAVWTFYALEPPAGTSTVQVFGEALVEVEVTNTETQATFTAPTATSTISVTPSNLGGWDIEVYTEAFGQSYRLLKYVPTWDPVPLAFDVFNGAWRVSVTNSCPNCVARFVTLPPPLQVTVTNQVASVALAGLSTPGPTYYLQRIRFMTAGGSVITNAKVSASSRTDPQLFLHPSIVAPWPPGNTNPPGVVDLPLPEGRWTVKASTGTDEFFGVLYGGWNVSREVDIDTNSPLPEITFVFPEPGVGPRLHGTLRASAGPPPDSGSVSLHMTMNGTNYDRTLSIDALGQFGTNVPPGRWHVQTYVNCSLVSVAVVSNQDVEVNLEYSVPVPGEPIPVSLSVVDDRGEPAPSAWATLNGFGFRHLLADPLLIHPLPPAVWTASLGDSIFSGTTPSYRLSPTFRWQLPPGAAPTSLVLVSRHATSRIEGRLRDEQGRLLLSGYAAAWTSVNGTNFQTYGTIASGYFSLNVFPGEWQVGADVSVYPEVGADGSIQRAVAGTKSGPLLSHYTRPATRFVQVSNDVVRCEFVTTNIPDLVTLNITVAREDGGPVDGLYIFAHGPATSQYSLTDLNGTATFLIAPGSHQISAYPGNYEVKVDPQLWPVLAADVSAPSNHVLLIALQPSTCIPGTLSNAPALGLQPQIFASTEINGTNYSITVCPDTDGRYCAPVFPGQWTVAMNSSTLPGNGIQTVAPREVTVPPIGEPPRANFTLTPIAGDFRTARLSTPVLLPDGRLRLELEGQAPLTWRIERSENLRDWTLVAIQSTAYRTLVIEEPPEPARRTAFYRAVWVK